MTTGRKLKIALVIFLVFFSGLALLPNFYSGLPEWWTKYCAPAGINLGLDLKGGLHVVLRVDRAKALENTLDFAATDFKNLLAEKGIIFSSFSEAVKHHPDLIKKYLGTVVGYRDN